MDRYVVINEHYILGKLTDESKQSLCKHSWGGCNNVCKDCKGFVMFYVDTCHEFRFGIAWNEEDIKNSVNFTDRNNVPCISMSYEYDLLKFNIIYEYLKKHRYVVFSQIDFNVFTNCIKLNYDMNEDFKLIVHNRYNHIKELYYTKIEWTLYHLDKNGIVTDTWESDIDD